MLSQDLFGGIAERLSRAVVVVDDGAAPIDGDDDVGRAVEKLLEVDRGKARNFGHARERGAIVGARRGTVKAALALVAFAGCFWHSYGRQTAAHADVLAAIARKGVDLVASGRLTAESMPELTYPLERAQAFAHDAATRAGGEPPPSLAALERLIERYRALLDALDRVRREPPPEGARAGLAPALDAVEEGARAVHAALVAEGRLPPPT
jgi:hypothetical protein